MPLHADAVLLPADPRTRHHSFKFKHILSHTAQYKHSFFVRTVPEWNSLPEAWINADTITAFQAQLRHTPWAVRTPPSSWYAKVDMAVATYEATEASASVVFTTLASVKTIISTSWILNMSFTSHNYIAVTHNCNCDRLSSSFKRQSSCALA